MPGSNRLHIAELKARSVPAWRVTRYSSSLSSRRHSSSVFTTLRSGAGLPFFAKVKTSGHRSIPLILGASYAVSFLGRLAKPELKKNTSQFRRHPAPESAPENPDR